METFELLSPYVHFYLYFAFGVILVGVIGGIFRKAPTYYAIFLSTILLFSWFSKDLFVYLPYDAMDVQRIIAKIAGSLIGVFVAHLWLRQRKKTRRLT